MLPVFSLSTTKPSELAATLRCGNGAGASAVAGTATVPSMMVSPRATTRKRFFHGTGHLGAILRFCGLPHSRPIRRPRRPVIRLSVSITSASRLPRGRDHPAGLDREGGGRAVRDGVGGGQSAAVSFPRGAGEASARLVLNNAGDHLHIAEPSAAVHFLAGKPGT